MVGGAQLSCGAGTKQEPDLQNHRQSTKGGAVVCRLQPKSPLSLRLMVDLALRALMGERSDRVQKTGRRQ